MDKVHALGTDPLNERIRSMLLSTESLLCMRAKKYAAAKPLLLESRKLDKSEASSLTSDFLLAIVYAKTGEQERADFYRDRVMQLWRHWSSQRLSAHPAEVSWQERLQTQILLNQAGSSSE